MIVSTAGVIGWTLFVTGGICNYFFGTIDSLNRRIFELNEFKNIEDENLINEKNRRQQKISLWIMGIGLIIGVFIDSTIFNMFSSSIRT